MSEKWKAGPRWGIQSVLDPTHSKVLTQLVVEHCRFLGMDSGAGKVAPMSYCPGELRKYWANVPESSSAKGAGTL